jgi:TonB family protein
MLRVLLASQPARAGWLGGTTFSTVTHGALIALAMVSSGTAITVHEERASAAPETITYVEPARFVGHLEDARTKGEGSSVAKVHDAAPAPQPMPTVDLGAISEAVSKIEIPDVTAATDLTTVTDAWLNAPDELSQPTEALASILAKKSAIVAPSNGIYTADLVERSVEPHRGNPKPRYPSSLASLGIEGSFLVRFVVDSTGTVPEDQIEFPHAMHRLFIAAVRTALLKSRYSPAMIAGRRVPQEVVQLFDFQMNDRRR